MNRIGWPVLGQALLIVAVATLGAAVHYRHVDKRPEVRFVRATPAPPHPASITTATQSVQPPAETVIRLINEAEAKKIFDDASGQFVDAREKAEFAKGHVPFALNLPFSALAAAKPPSLDQLVPQMPTIVYCEGGDCESSKLVARHLTMQGFTDVRVIEAGFPAWEKAGYPTRKGEK